MPGTSPSPVFQFPCKTSHTSSTKKYTSIKFDECCFFCKKCTNKVCSTGRVNIPNQNHNHRKFKSQDNYPVLHNTWTPIGFRFFLLLTCWMQFSPPLLTKNPWHEVLMPVTVNYETEVLYRWNPLDRKGDHGVEKSGIDVSPSPTARCFRDMGFFE